MHNGHKEICESCNKSFPQKSSLKIHIRSVHHGINHKCIFCGKSFPLKSSLKIHIRIVHDGIKSHKCILCGKSFPHENSLKIHIHTVHEGKKDHKCNFCGKYFSQKGSVKRHINEFHDDIKRDYICTFCEQTFSREYRLIVHISSIHKEITKGLPSKDQIEEILYEEKIQPLTEMVFESDGMSPMKKSQKENDTELRSPKNQNVLQPEPIPEISINIGTEIENDIENDLENDLENDIENGIETGIENEIENGIENPTENDIEKECKSSNIAKVKLSDKIKETSSDNGNQQLSNDMPSSEELPQSKCHEVDLIDIENEIMRLESNKPAQTEHEIIPNHVNKITFGSFSWQNKNDNFKDVKNENHNEVIDISEEIVVKAMITINNEESYIVKIRKSYFHDINLKDLKKNMPLPEPNKYRYYIKTAEKCFEEFDDDSAILPLIKDIITVKCRRV